MLEVSRQPTRVPSGFSRAESVATLVLEGLLVAGAAWALLLFPALAPVSWQPAFMLCACTSVLMPLFGRAARGVHLRVPGSLLLPTLILLALSAAEVSSAASMQWEGTISVSLSSSPDLSVEASGEAVVIDNGNGFTLQTLRPVGDSFGTDTFLLTDPEVPTIAAIRLEAGVGFGTLAPFDPLAPLSQPQLTKNILPLYGTLKLCVLSSACSAYIPIPLASPSFGAAVGVGGLITLGPGGMRISVEAAPWTLRDATITVETPSGSSFQLATSGSAHGPHSFTGSTALTGGQLSLVTPMLITSNELDVAPAAFARLTLRFVPEPGLLLLLASGVAGLWVLSRIHRGGQP
jgi:hypothetical protein